MFEMGVISLSTLGTKGVMFAVWVSGSVRIYMCRFSWLVFNSVNLLGILLVVLLMGYFITPFFGLVINKVNEFTQIRPNKVNRPKHRSYSTLNSIASQDKTLKQSLLCNEEGPGGGSDATAFSSYTINPWFLTGFTDGEGSFILSVVRNKESKVGWRVKPLFQIGLHKKDKALLEQIKSYFGVGKINSTHGPETIQYYVASVKDLAVVISHF